MGGTVHDLVEFEQAYAPPFSSAKDPINVAGFIAENIFDGLSRTVTWRDVESFREKGAFVLDVRTMEEFALGAIPGAYNIPNTELRERMNEVPRDKPILIYCAVGLRGYLGERILKLNGYADVANLTGGYKTWKEATSEQEFLAGAGERTGLFDRNIMVTAKDGSQDAR